MLVHLPSALRSYVGEASTLEVEGSTVAEVLAELDRRYPGLRFRVVDEAGELRPHIKLLVGTRPVVDLDTSLDGEDPLHLVLALSGG